LALCSLLALGARRANAECADGGAGRVALTSGLAVGAGAASALVTAGVLAAADDSRDFKFGVGAGVGIGVAAGITAIYAVVDASTDCAMVTEADGIVWSIPIVTAVLGALLPLAVWGAADEVGAADEPTANPALHSAFGGSAPHVSPGASMTFRF
jgi:hypothetical protein